MRHLNFLPIAILFVLMSGCDKDDTSIKPVSSQPEPPPGPIYPFVLDYGQDSLYHEVLVLEEKQVSELTSASSKDLIPIKLNSDNKIDLALLHDFMGWGTQKLPYKRIIVIGANNDTVDDQDWRILTVSGDENTPQHIQKGDALLPVRYSKSSTRMLYASYPPWLPEFPPKTNEDVVSSSSGSFQDTTSHWIMAYKPPHPTSIYLIKLQIVNHTTLILHKIKELQLREIH